MKQITGLRVGAATDPGRTRKLNQDGFGGPPELLDPKRIARKGVLYENVGVEGLKRILTEFYEPAPGEEGQIETVEDV